METRPEVKKLLDEMESMRWFHRVGEPLSIPRPRIWAFSRVGSWDEAYGVITSRETEEFLIDSQNELYRELNDAIVSTKPQKVWNAEFTEWIRAMRDPLHELATAACADVTIPAYIGEKYHANLYWMMQKACVIRQYDEYIVENRLYCYVLDLLRAGHCVCGWQEEYPGGSLVVY